MAETPPDDAKRRSLQQQGTLNPRPKAVTDELFTAANFSIPAIWSRSSTRCCAGSQTEGQSVPGGHGELRLFAAIFLSGDSPPSSRTDCRPGATQARSEASAQAHRRSPRIHRRGAPERTIRSIAGTGEADPGRFGTGSSAKHRTQLATPSKKTSADRATPAARPPSDLVARYEQLRCAGAWQRWPSRPRLGLALFLRRGMTAWMQAWSECAPHCAPEATLSA